MSRTSKKSPAARLLKRYRMLPHDLHSRKFSVRNRAQRLMALTICVPVIIAAVLYISHWFSVKHRIENENRSYSALYVPDVTPEASDTLETAVSVNGSATQTATSLPTGTPEVSETSDPTERPTVKPTEGSTAGSPLNASPTPSAEPSPAPTAVFAATPTPTSVPTAEPFAIAQDDLLIISTTPDADTAVLALATAPPVQDSFRNLLAVNSETVGYLTIGSQISLPVVQRPNDNDYYLSHNFSGQDSEGGTLFLDGSCLLVPEDPVLLVYGHNMRNGTMFQPLTNFERPDYLRDNAIVRFDTVYEDRLYTLVAVFTESADPDSEDYFDLRQFTFDETLWELYILKMEKRSIYDLEIDAKYGDRLLLLVTCEYTHDNGRLVVALRQLRDGESEESARERLKNVQLK